MSVENLKEYARRCATEPELCAAARELGASDVDGHIQHAAGLGLDWSQDDMVAFRKEVLAAEGDDYATLSEEDLEQVAGGVASITAAVVLGVATGVSAGIAVGVVGGVATATATSGSAW